MAGLRRRLGPPPAVLPLLIGMACADAASAAGAFYVDGASPACLDTNPGTEAQPFCTITAAAAAQGGAGSTIFVKPAVYREQVTVPASGAPGAPFVFQALGSPVVLDGSESFSDPALWLHHAGSTWRAPSVTWTPKQVLVDGSRLLASNQDPSTLPAGTFNVIPGEGLYANTGGSNPGLRATFVGRRNHGFRITARSWIDIQGFLVTRCDDAGIQAAAGSADLRIAGNTSTWNNAPGISVVGTARAEVAGNTVSDNNRHGIYLLNGTTASVVDGNEAMRNSRHDGVGINGIKVENSPGNLVQRNRTHDNQDSGLQINFSDDTVARLNISWNNGDHGFDHIGSRRAVHVSQLARGNRNDGFSFEGGSTEASMHDSISADNGVATGNHDLFVDAVSAAGFRSDSNVFWNATGNELIRFNGVDYSTLAAFTAATGQEVRGLQQDPLFQDATAGDFSLSPGSPAIDSADTLVPFWPGSDIDGRIPVDDPLTANTGAGSPAYADRGPLEFYGHCNEGAGPAIEVCDGEDNDCDGATDDAMPPPAVQAMDASLPSWYLWPPVAGTDFYQVVRGGLGILRSSSGDFAAATGACLEDGTVSPTFQDPAAPPAGDGFWYLVRAVNCGGGGTYDSGQASQAGPRDAEIEASPQRCL